MSRIAAVALAVLAGGAFASPAAHAQQVEPGEWDFVTDVTMPGLPRPQQSGLRTCLTREGTRDPLRWSAHRLPADCRAIALKLGPDTVSWEMECPSSGMRGKGNARLGKGSLQSETQLGGGASVDMRSRTQGRRLGPCTP